MKRILLLLLAWLPLCAAMTAQVSPEVFRHPEPDTHVVAWWHWLNGNITREGITRDLEAMKAVGIHQATFLNVYRDMPDADVPQKVRFNTPQWWQMVRWAMQEASRLGMTLGAANCDGWSESGGPWITPDQSMKHYTTSRTPVNLSLDRRGRLLPTAGSEALEVMLPMPDHKQDYYRDVCVLLYPALASIDPEDVVDVTRYVDVMGKLRLPAGFVPAGQKMAAGKYIILRFGYTTTGKTNNPATWEGRGLECDKMDTTALNWHWSHYPQRLIDLAREVDPSVFRYLLVDSWEAGPQTWTQRLPEEFLTRRGYDIRPWLPALCGDTLIDRRHTEAFLHDFRRTLGELVGDCYFKHFSELCHRQGLLMYSEGIYGERKNPPVDVLRTYQYCDVPMTEFWARIPAHDWPYEYNPWPEKTFIYPVHSAVLYDKPIIGSEAYTGYALYSDSPIDLKAYGDRAFCEGVNSMMLHSYVHQPTEQRPGMTLGVYGQSFNRHNPWFPESSTWMDFQARVQTLLRQGARCSDALVYTGDELPCPQWTPQESDSVMQGVKFNYVNPDVLLSGRLTVDARHQLVLDGRHTFQCLVLRDSLMELPTLRVIARLAEAGARIYGPKPVRTLSLTGMDENDRQLLELADRVWALPGVSTDVLAMPRQIQREVEGWSGDYIHRRTSTLDLYYLVNPSYQDTLTCDVTFRVSAPSVTLWDPVDGSVGNVTSLSVHAGSTSVPMRLAPRQSLFVVFGPDMATSAQRQMVSLSPKAEALAPLELTGAGVKVHFDDDASIPDQTLSAFASLTSHADPAIRYYSGRVTYTIPFTLTHAQLTSCGSVRLEVPSFGSTARIVLNGNYVDTFWIPGQQADVTDGVREGRNVLTMVVTNPWRNRLIGDLVEGKGRCFTTSPTTMKNDPVPVVHRSASLLPAGISQPILLRFLQ